MRAKKLNKARAIKLNNLWAENETANNHIDLIVSEQQEIARNKIDILTSHLNEY